MKRVAAARAGRQAVGVAVLIAARRREVHARELRLGLADREPRDLARDAEVLLEERGRDAERRRDVVEAVDLDLVRQVLLRVDLDAEQVLHRRGVLGAVQALHRRVARARLVRVAVDRGFSPAHELLDVLLIRSRVAGRRHQPAAQLADRGLEHLGLRGDGVGADAFEHDAACCFGLVMTVGAVGLERLPLLGAALRLEPRVQRIERGRAAGCDYEDPDSDADAFHRLGRIEKAGRRRPAEAGTGVATGLVTAPPDKLRKAR